jgi:hypothetical protein
MLACPASRRMVMARFRKVAMTRRSKDLVFRLCLFRYSAGNPNG